MLFGKSKRIKELEARLHDAESLLAGIKGMTLAYADKDNKRKKFRFCKDVIKAIDGYKHKYENYGE